MRSKARYCQEGGCKDAWWIGGNYGSYVCPNTDHHRNDSHNGPAPGLIPPTYTTPAFLGLNVARLKRWAEETG